MSYYSDVKCVMYKKNWLEVQDKILTSDIDDWAKDKFQKPEIIEKENNIVIVCWDNINHWDCDPAVEIFMEYLKKEAYENDMPFNYIYVGEGCGTETDIEHLYNYPDDDLDVYLQFNVIGYNISIDIF